MQCCWLMHDGVVAGGPLSRPSNTQAVGSGALRRQPPLELAPRALACCRRRQPLLLLRLGRLLCFISMLLFKFYADTSKKFEVAGRLLRGAACGTHRGRAASAAHAAPPAAIARRRRVAAAGAATAEPLERGPAGQEMQGLQCNVKSEGRAARCLLGSLRQLRRQQMPCHLTHAEPPPASSRPSKGTHLMRCSRERPEAALPALLAEPCDSCWASWRVCWRTSENLDRVGRVVCFVGGGGGRADAGRWGDTAQARCTSPSSGTMPRPLPACSPCPARTNPAMPGPHLSLCRQGIDRAVQRQKLLWQRHAAAQDLRRRHAISIQAGVQARIHKRPARCTGEGAPGQGLAGQASPAAGATGHAATGMQASTAAKAQAGAASHRTDTSQNMPSEHAAEHAPLRRTASLCLRAVRQRGGCLLCWEGGASGRGHTGQCQLKHSCCLVHRASTQPTQEREHPTAPLARPHLSSQPYTSGTPSHTRAPT